MNFLSDRGVNHFVIGKVQLCWKDSALLERFSLAGRVHASHGGLAFGYAFSKVRYGKEGGVMYHE